jgi:hypothetical protein
MKKQLLFILILINALPILAQRPADQAQLKADISFLASDAMKGRLTGSIYQDIAAEFIASRFLEIGLKTKGDKNSYLQTFYYAPSADPHNTANLSIHSGDSVKIINVAGYIDNGGLSTIIIGAHYDHLGEGTSFQPFC